jgi:hypothetical protein
MLMGKDDLGVIINQTSNTILVDSEIFELGKNMRYEKTKNGYDLYIL